MKFLTPLMGLFLLCSSLGTYAQENALPFNQCINISSVFVNGMNTQEDSERGAGIQRLKIEELLMSLHILDSSDFVKLSYNPTEGAFTDFTTEVWGQLAFNNIVYDYREQYPNDKGTIFESQYYQRQVQLFPSYTDNPAIGRTVRNVRKVFQEMEENGREGYVFLIGYSQGNWVSNWAYDYLISQPNPQYNYEKYLKVIGIGSPAYRVAGYPAWAEEAEYYVTLENDGIISAANVGFPVMVPNVPANDTYLAGNGEDVKRHGLIDEYLLGTNSRNTMEFIFTYATVEALLEAIDAGEADDLGCISLSVQVDETEATGDINNGKISLDENISSLSLTGKVNLGVLQRITGIFVKFNGELLNEDMYSFNQENTSFDIQLENIPSGSSTLTVEPFYYDENLQSNEPLRVYPVSTSEAKDGLLPSEDYASSSLTIVKGGHSGLECTLEAADYVSSLLSVSVLDTNLGYAYGFPKDINKEEYNAKFKLQLKGVPNEYKHCFGDIQINDNDQSAVTVDAENLIYEITYRRDEGQLYEFKSFLIGWSDDLGIIADIEGYSESVTGYPVSYSNKKRYCDLYSPISLNDRNVPLGLTGVVCYLYKNSLEYSNGVLEVLRVYDYQSDIGSILESESFYTGTELEYYQYTFISSSGNLINYLKKGPFSYGEGKRPNYQEVSYTGVIGQH